MYYDEIAKGYDELHRKEQERKINLIKKNIKFYDDDRVLDIGCGPYYGHWPGAVTGIDPAWELLKNAECTKIKGVAEDLPFEDHVFDMVVSITALQNFKDIKKALEEAKRVGKSRFVLSYLKKSKKSARIEKQIRGLFTVINKIEDKHDVIFFLTTKYKNQSIPTEDNGKKNL